MGKEAANDCSGLSVSEKKIPESSDYVDKIDGFVRETQPPSLRFYGGDGDDYEVWCRRDDNLTSTGGGGGANTHINKQLFDVFSFESPAMAAGIRFPFTFAQWKELERQAAIYKYMVSCLPVPPELLYPLIRNLVSPSMEDDFTSPSSCMRLRNGDLVPGRCKRTDGKKWRCSREVAPHQKYCERHLHRGRPRSRKQVEVKTTQSDCKKMRVIHKTCSPASSSSSPQDFLTGNNHHLPLCDPRDSINREMESIMVDHHHLNQGYATLFNQQQSLDTLFFPNFPAPEIEAGPHQGGDGKEEEEEGRKESRWMSPLSWELLIGGGPLAEALQLGSPRESINAAAATTVSSPSGVLQRTPFPHTDGSVCNSPTLCPETAFHWLN